MDSSAFKYQHHYRQQNQHLEQKHNNNSINNKNNSGSSRSSNTSHNHKNQNSIFILNAAANNIYSDFNDNNVASLLSSWSAKATNTTTASSSVWSSASSTMCSPAAQAIQKLFNCSSSNGLKVNHGNYSGIESKSFKAKSEILKKKSKFWKYLEGEANDKNHQRGIEDKNKLLTKSFKCKSKYWPKSYESDNQNQQDLSELLEYSCTLCDNCRCVDCQIGYFDCENSDDSNSEYSFHLSAYEEDDELDGTDDENLELKTSTNTHMWPEASYETCPKLEIDSKPTPLCAGRAYCICNDVNCFRAQCCEHCFIESIKDDGGKSVKSLQDCATIH